MHIYDLHYLYHIHSKEYCGEDRIFNVSIYNFHPGTAGLSFEMSHAISGDGKGTTNVKLGIMNYVLYLGNK